jgi:hypothetical protein
MATRVGSVFMGALSSRREGMGRHGDSSPRHLGSLRLDRVAGRLPGIEAAEQGVGFREALFAELERHTGARRFLRSGSVGQDEAIPGPAWIDPDLGIGP